MEPFHKWLNSLVNNNKSEFEHWPDIKWLSPYKAQEYQDYRDNLLNKIDDQVLFKATKPYHNRISKGCQICGDGKWSCLFITNKCNASCFYCPTSQSNDEPPSTQGIEFENAYDYALYVKHFDFDGVSISGGEPFLFFDRSYAYLKAVKEICKSDLYAWIYTNGILVEKEKLWKLADIGLNEIRFDIGATAYSLDQVELASGIIPNITVEIPAIAEKKDLIISLLPRMIELGVTNLNLHHLRLTKHNANSITRRAYTIINAERPLVLESELAALEIVNAANEMGLNIGVNYCSFHFKNRFQKAGYRKMLAKKILPFAVITQNGYVREISGNVLSYKTFKLLNDATVLTGLSSYCIDGKEYGVLEQTVFSKAIPISTLAKIESMFINEPAYPPSDPLLFEVWQYEYVEVGLRDY